MGDADAERMVLFRTHVQAFVSLRILELRALSPGLRAVQCEYDVHRARTSRVFDERADLLFGSPQIGAVRTRKDREDSAQIMHLLVNGLAALAMSAPGGVTFLDMHWCTDHSLCVEAEQHAQRVIDGRASNV